MFVKGQKLNFKRIITIVVLVLGVAGLAIIIKNYFSPKPKYNLILISVDTLRADHMGVYGYTKNTTPKGV